jgi:hypothetical protein
VDFSRAKQPQLSPDEFEVLEVPFLFPNGASAPPIETANPGGVEAILASRLYRPIRAQQRSTSPDARTRSNLAPDAHPHRLNGGTAIVRQVAAWRQILPRPARHIPRSANAQHIIPLHMTQEKGGVAAAPADRVGR